MPNLDELLTMIVERRPESERYELLLAAQTLWIERLEAQVKEEPLSDAQTIDYAMHNSYLMAVVVSELEEDDHQAFEPTRMYSDAWACMVDPGWTLPHAWEGYRVKDSTEIQELLCGARQAIKNCYPS